ncbi:MAG: IS110 family transposase [Ktedonobacteraceae bacterium]|nr:IS110 family transposase [Ktedonobacteraceae bacterium]
MWYAGIDWSDTHHDVMVIDDVGKQVVSKRVAHTKAGLDQLVVLLQGILGSEPKEQMACVVETNHGLLITTLLEAGFAVYPVHPKTVDRRRGAAGGKTDQIDAYLLAKYGRAELADLRKLQPDSPGIAELKALTRDQESLIEMQTRLVNQLTACLKGYYPVALSLFTKLQQRSTLLFLQASPTPADALAATEAHLAQTLKQGKHPKAQAVAAKIFQHLRQPSLTADEVTIRTKARLMKALVLQLLPLVEQIAEYEEAIETLFLSHADNALFASLPGAGQRLAPRLLAEIGDDRERYPNAQGLAALAGTAPVLYQSGNFSKAHRRHACLKHLRNALYQFAWQSTRSQVWAREYCQRKRKEGKSHSVALRALWNIWVRIIYAMWRTRRPYDPAVFEKARHDHALMAA